MGTQWAITVWDALDPTVFSDIKASIIAASRAFDETYSRFKKSSLVWKLADMRGVIDVPRDLVAMLRIYATLYDLSGGLCTPLVGFSLSDLGYDAEYSLRKKDIVRPVPEFHQAISIVDDTHIELRDAVLIDLGALGKGFFVDRIAEMLRERGIKKFLVNGSGDIYYRGNGDSIRVGLEHPDDPTKVIGTIDMTDGSMCASSGNRRTWNSAHHIINPHSLASPTDIIATWVIAEKAAIADGLATCLFFNEPERFQQQWTFEYCMLNHEYNVKRSKGFHAELF